MALTDTDRALLRDELGDTPDDATLEDWHDDLGHWIPVAIRALKRRRASTVTGGADVTSFALPGVLSVGLGKADLPALDRQIARLERAWATHQGQEVGRIRRPDRYR